LRLLYLDVSALVKLALQEPETPALIEFLRSEESAGIALEIAEVEVERAVHRMGGSASDAATALRHVTLLELDERVRRLAAALDPPSLRTLDALDAAAALSLHPGPDAIVTYDGRLAGACRARGLAVVTPA
jgi:predicted nucleic acid-binding protein